MTYNVLMGTLNPTHSLTTQTARLSITRLLRVGQYVNEWSAPLTVPRVETHADHQR